LSDSNVPPHFFSSCIPHLHLLCVTDCYCYPTLPPPQCIRPVWFFRYFSCIGLGEDDGLEKPMVSSSFLSRTREDLSILYSSYIFLLSVICEAGGICSQQVLIPERAVHQWGGWGVGLGWVAWGGYYYCPSHQVKLQGEEN